MRTGFVVQGQTKPNQGIVSVYDYLKAMDPVSIEVLGYMQLFSEEDYLAPPAAARYVPVLDEKLSREELLDLMKAPGEDRRRGLGSTEASA
jgi:hypothetical protein